MRAGVEADCTALSKGQCTGQWAVAAQLGQHLGLKGLHVDGGHGRQRNIPGQVRHGCSPRARAESGAESALQCWNTLPFKVSVDVAVPYRLCRLYGKSAMVCI